MNDNQTKNILIVFAPAFLNLAKDLVNSLKKKEENLKITAVCTGGYKIVNYVKKNLDKDLIDEIYNLEKEEKKWIKRRTVNYEYIKSYDEKFGHDFLGRVLTSDRRIGNGYVLGGVSRPNYLADMASKNSEIIPLAYVEGSLRFFEDIFKRKKFNLVFLYVVASSQHLLISYFAKFHKANFRCLYHSRISDRNFLDSSPFGDLEILKRKFHQEDIVISEKSQKKALNYLQNFRDKPITPDYTSYFSNKKDNLIKDGVYFIAYFIAYNLRFLLPKGLKDEITKDKLRHKLFYFKINFQKLYKRYKFSKQIPDQKYVYFPLHVDPEASTMVLSPFHTNQISLIENLSKSIPSDHILLVKEHIPMIGYRPKGFYKTIQSMPRVRLISPFFDQFTIISKASFICSITGTAGLEGLLLKKKVLLIADRTPYSFFEKGLIVESDISKLSERFQELDKKELLDDVSILRYLALIFQESFQMKNGLIWENYFDQPESEKNAFLSELTDQIHSLIND